MSATVTAIPSLGFVRGAIVRHGGIGPNMLVVRSDRSTTAIVVCEGDAKGDLRLRQYFTDALSQVLPANGYVEEPPMDLLQAPKREVPFR